MEMPSITECLIVLGLYGTNAPGGLSKFSAAGRSCYHDLKHMLPEDPTTIKCYPVESDDACDKLAHAFLRRYGFKYWSKTKVVLGREVEAPSIEDDQER